MQRDQDEVILNSFVAQRLKQHRERRNMTREMLARRLYVEVTAIERAEAGEARLDALYLYEACQLLGVSLRTFFEGYDVFREETIRKPAAHAPAAESSLAGAS